MYKLDASQFHNAIVILQRTISTATNPGFPKDNVMTTDNRHVTVTQLSSLKSHVEVLKCPITLMAISDAIGLLNEDPGVTYFAYAQLANGIANTLRNELTLKKVYVLDPQRSDFYEAQAIFGSNVAAKFPGITYEIAEAGNCYACDRSTASAFHSIRCLEAGIRAISRCLGIPDPTKGSDRNWSNVSRDIKAKIDAKWPASSGRMSGDAQIFDEIYGSLVGMQNPYRNATMHLEATYTAPEAIYIFEVVRGLMSRIASRMDEYGLPLA